MSASRPSLRSHLSYRIETGPGRRRYTWAEDRYRQAVTAALAEPDEYTTSTAPLRHSTPGQIRYADLRLCIGAAAGGIPHEIALRPFCGDFSGRLDPGYLSGDFRRAVGP